MLRARWPLSHIDAARCALALACTLLPGAIASAQTTTAAAPLDLKSAVAQALEHYPAIAETRGRAAAADAGVGVARTAYLPRLDLVWQENRATRNNIFGLLLPQAVVPSISGPVLGTTSLDSVWGSAGGLLLSWEPIDFGQRRASVEAARAQSAAAQARTTVTQLDVATAAADAFLSAVAAEQAVRAAQANVDRLQVFARAVHVLVDNQLRAGAEASRADAELAAANTQLAQAIQTRDLARVALADAIGSAGADITLAPGDLAAGMPELPDIAGDVESHPAAVAQAAAVSAVEARARAIERSPYPHVTLQGAFSGRGSGADVSGAMFEGSGAWLQVPNWAAGVTVSFPALEFVGARARGRVEQGNLAAEQARYQQTIDTLRTAGARARALVAAATTIARNTPVQLAAARETESRARARYDSGLASITEVADAQRLLAQAEVDDAVARVAVWRALLAEASVHGDLKPFLDRVR